MPASRRGENLVGSLIAVGADKTFVLASHLLWKKRKVRRRSILGLVFAPMPRGTPMRSRDTTTGALSQTPSMGGRICLQGLCPGGESSALQSVFSRGPLLIRVLCFAADFFAVDCPQEQDGRCQGFGYHVFQVGGQFAVGELLEKENHVRQD